MHLLDRDAFLTANLDDVDAVLAKSHYHDAAVTKRLRATHARVVNDPDATAICASRFSLATCLDAGGIPTPPFLGGRSNTKSMALPWIAKPDRGGDHQLHIIEELPAIVDRKNVFYQQWLPTNRVMKVYSVGSSHAVVELTYTSEREITKPVRTYLGPASGPLRSSAQAVAEATTLEVFNTDFIEHDGKLLAIDVNPFPSLESVPEGDEYLWQLLEDEKGRWAGPRKDETGFQEDVEGG